MRMKKISFVGTEDWKMKKAFCPKKKLCRWYPQCLLFSRTPFLSYLISSSFFLLFFYSLHLKSSLLFLMIVLFSVIFSLSYLSYLSPLSHICLHLYLPLISSYLIFLSYYTLPYLLIRISPLILTMKCSLLFLFDDDSMAPTVEDKASCEGE